MVSSMKRPEYLVLAPYIQFPSPTPIAKTPPISRSASQGTSVSTRQTSLQAWVITNSFFVFRGLWVYRVFGSRFEDLQDSG